MTDYFTFDRETGFEIFDGIYYNQHVGKRVLKSTTTDKIGPLSMNIHTTEPIGTANEAKVTLTLVDIAHDRHGHLGTVVLFRPIYILDLFAFLNQVNMASIPATLKSIDESIEGIWRSQ